MQPEKPPVDKIDIRIINQTGNPISVKLSGLGIEISADDMEKYSYLRIENPRNWNPLEKRFLPNGIFEITGFERSNKLLVTQLDAKGTPTKIELKLTTAGIFKKPGTAIFIIKSAPNKKLTEIVDYNALSLQTQQGIKEGEVKKAVEYESIMGLTQKIGPWRRVLDLINDESKPTISEQDIYDALDINVKDLDQQLKRLMHY